MISKDIRVGEGEIKEHHPIVNNENNSHYQILSTQTGVSKWHCFVHYFYNQYFAVLLFIQTSVHIIFAYHLFSFSQKHIKYQQE